MQINGEPPEPALQAPAQNEDKFPPAINRREKTGAAGAVERNPYIQAQIDGNAAWIKSVLTRFPQEDAIAMIARAIVAEKLLGERYKDLAYIDPLTGLPNKRAFLESYESIIKENKRAAVLILDIDNFKLFNDTYGHPAGDSALFQASRRIQSVLRITPPTSQMALERRKKESNDLPARYGGEEFAIVLEDIDNEEDLAVVADKIVKAFSNSPFIIKVDGVEKPVEVTISVGGGIYRGQGQEFLEQVDKNGLYAAKQGGRNRFVILPAPKQTQTLQPAVPLEQST